jgi:starch synthase
MTEGKLKVLFLSAEVFPYAKTGGLADVAGSLPKYLSASGCDISVAMPGYGIIKNDMEYVTDFSVDMEGRKESCIVKRSGMTYKIDGKEGSVPIYFICNHQYFDRQNIYCYGDDAKRFAFFCKAVIKMLPETGLRPDIIHCNDWHTGPVIMLLKEKYGTDPFYENIKTLYTIHNLEYQGNFPKEILGLFDFGMDVFTPEKAEFYGMFGFMKTGIAYADIINTVSKVYAQEICTDKYGEGMHGLLKKRKKDLFGILNGISFEEFNPEKDKRIYKNYGIDTLDSKSVNKYELQREMELPKGDMPVIGIISRLSGQKGLDLVIQSIDNLLEKDVQLILLGKGDSYYENAFINIMKKNRNKVSVYIGFNTDLAQKIYAGCDMFLMPSRFEPCGLGQLISLRYGTIPVVRATGGLAETITDYDQDAENGNGFVFDEFSQSAMFNSLSRAIRLYEKRPDKWKELVKRAMMLDYSWSTSAVKYLDIYKKAINKKQPDLKGKAEK